jgi:hypothetical protein
MVCGRHPYGSTTLSGDAANSRSNETVGSIAAKRWTVPHADPYLPEDRRLRVRHLEGGAARGARTQWGNVAKRSRRDAGSGSEGPGALREWRIWSAVPHGGRTRSPTQAGQHRWPSLSSAAVENRARCDSYRRSATRCSRARLPLTSSKTADERDVIPMRSSPPSGLTRCAPTSVSEARSDDDLPESSRRLQWCRARA